MLPRNHRQLKNELFKAIQQRKLSLYYQPIFNFVTNKFDSVEALLRWEHPIHGILLPEDFLPLISNHSLIGYMGRWVLQTACKQTKRWQKNGLIGIRIAVNVSTHELQYKNFVEVVMNTLRKNGLKTQHLELEITENVVIHKDSAVMINNVRRLKTLGVTISLDDFGTGYASIAYLKKIPLNKIKIDKEFITDIHTNDENSAIVLAIITLAASLNLHVLAEGVESVHQYRTLLEHKCTEAQGFYFSKPMPTNEAENFLFFYRNHSFL